jgi:hypothetical protein
MFTVPSFPFADKRPHGKVTLTEINVVKRGASIGAPVTNLKINRRKFSVFH